MSWKASMSCAASSSCRQSSPLFTMIGRASQPGLRPCGESALILLRFSSNLEAGTPIAVNERDASTVESCVNAHSHEL